MIHQLHAIYLETSTLLYPFTSTNLTDKCLKLFEDCLLVARTKLASENIADVQGITSTDIDTDLFLIPVVPPSWPDTKISLN